MDIATILYSPRVGAMVQFTMILYTFGSCISFLVTLGSLLPDVDEQFHLSFVDTKTSAVLYSGLISTTLCFIDQLDSLRFSSFLGLICAFYLSFMIIGAAVTNWQIASIEQITFKLSMFDAVPVYSIAYAAHYNTPDVFKELGSDMSKFKKVITTEGLLVFTLYVAVGLAGYFQFGSDVTSQVLHDYGNSNNFALWARLSLAFSVIFTYPFPFFCFRKNLVSLLSRCYASRRAAAGSLADQYVLAGDTPTPPSLPSGELKGPLKFLLILVLNGLVIMTSLVVPSVDTILDFKGALLGTPIIYVFPGLFYLAVLRKHFPEASAWYQLPRDQLLGPCVLICFGMVTGLLALQSKLRSYIH